MSGPLKMYSLKPIIRHDLPVELPSCMYRLKNIHAVRNGSVIRETDHVSTKNENLGTFDQNNQQHPEMAALIIRQEQILQQLMDLKNQMASLRESLNISKPSKSSVVTSSNVDMLAEAVINVGFSHPPYCLLALQKIWGNNFHLKIKSHLHSSVNVFPENILNFVTKLQNFNPVDTNAPEISLRLIWKNVGPQAELITSKVPILGEVNILRYLARITSSLNYETSNIFEIDSLLDICYLLVRSPTKTERSSLLKALNKKLGKSEWLLGCSEISIADVALYSALSQIPANEVNVTMTRWLEKCKSNFE